MIDDLTKQLKADEGWRNCAYKDSLGYLTIGVGRLVDPVKKCQGLRDNEIEFMLHNDVQELAKSLQGRLPFFTQLNDARQGALANMAFQLGIDGLLAFKNTLAAVESGCYEQAAKLMLQSKWATQTPQRAKRLAEQIKTGKWVFQ